MTRRSILSAAAAASLAAARAKSAQVAAPARAAQSAARGNTEQIRLPKKVRVAVIGFEGHASEITEPLAQLPDIEIAAYVDRRDRAAAYAAAKRYTDYREMLDKENLDVVAVTNDDGARAAAVIECAKHKVHIVAEKPLAIRREDYDRVKRAVIESGVKATLILNYRFLPHFLALKKVVASGEIGEVIMVNGQKSYKVGASNDWRSKTEAYSGTIPWVGIHMTDLMEWISGRRFTECAAMQAHIGFPEIGARENTAGALFRMDNRGVATLNLDYVRPDAAQSHDDDRLRLGGTEGVAEYQRATGVLVVNKKNGVRKLELPPKQSLFADFLRWVYLGEKPTITMDEMWRANEVVLGAREAAETGKTVRL